MNVIKELLGQRIKKFRAEKKITQEQFSELIGISPRSLSYIETGKNYPSADTLFEICRVLNVKPNRLYDFEGYKDFGEVKKELYDRIEKDEDFGRLLYQISQVL